MLEKVEFREKASSESKEVTLNDKCEIYNIDAWITKHINNGK